MRRRRELTHVVLIRGLEKRLQDDAAWQRALRDQQRTATSSFQ